MASALSRQKCCKVQSQLTQKIQLRPPKIIKSHPGSGAEFRHIYTIEKILHRREDWQIIKSILTQGCDYPFKDGAFTSTQLVNELKKCFNASIINQPLFQNTNK